jgi:hypothetical protein
MELEQEQMKIMQAIAEANIKISDARTELSTLKAEHDSYLKERENEVMEKLEALLDSSDEIIKKINKNHLKITDITKTVCGFADFIADLGQKTSDTIEEFKLAQERFHVYVVGRERQLGLISEENHLDRKRLDDAEEMINRKKEFLQKQEGVLQGRIEVLKGSYRAEKDLWEKIQKTK